MKVVINSCYGGFGLSNAAKEMLGIEYDFEYMDDYEKRADPKLVEVVEKLGATANGPFAKLKVVEIPDDVDWTITEYDGAEQIEEVHRIWD